MWEALREGRTGVKFRRQQVIVGYIVDFYAPARRLVVEVDGEIHDEPEVMARDAVRTEALMGCGLRVLRVTNAAVMTRLDEVLVRIRAALEDDG